MTRPKVPDDKRQRTAQACDSCKRRKQKCNGLKPCQTCLKRKLICNYTPNHHASSHVAESSVASPTKRRHLGTSPPSVTSSLEMTPASVPHAYEPMQTWDQRRSSEQRPPVPPSLPAATTNLLPTLPVTERSREPPFHLKALPSRANPNGLSEEMTIYTETRMLQDQTGRLLYIGDSSTLSILQLIRIVVENTAGSEIGSPFIHDPKRHRIMENIIEFPPDAKIPTQLPDRETANVLIESFFTNTCGVIEVLDKALFLESVETCYQDPPSASNRDLCHLFLVLALGLLLAAPAPGSREEEIIIGQRSKKPDRGELYFRSAKSMCDPGSGFEDADFWSIQALAMMTLYMLTISKRNTAYAYLGMAVRSAYALGLHREETMRDVIFTPDQMRVRRNLWKTLFILDRFLAAILGRPTAISEEDCSCKIFPGEHAEHNSANGNGFDDFHISSLDSCVETSRIIGVTLKVFTTRKISTAKVQEIIDMSRDWDEVERTYLYRRQSIDGGLNHSAFGIASLHVNLMSLHSLILVTRQLFVMHNWLLVEQRSGIKKSPPIGPSQMARYSQACVVASYRTIKLVKAAYDGGYLPRRNPFIIYFMFAASLVILLNQFSSLYKTRDYESTMADSIEIMKYCSEIDPQAERVLDIILRFSRVVTNWTRDHTYHDAPELSNDLSYLRTKKTATGGLLHADQVQQVPAAPSFREIELSRAPSLSDPGLLTPPAVSKMPLLDTVATQPSSAMVSDSGVHGASPSQTSMYPITVNGSRPSVSATSSVEGSEPPSINIEFQFDNLWTSVINHLPPVSTVAPGINTLASQFPPPVMSTPTEPFGGCSFPVPDITDRRH